MLEKNLLREALVSYPEGEEFETSKSDDLQLEIEYFNTTYDEMYHIGTILVCSNGCSYLSIMDENDSKVLFDDYKIITGINMNKEQFAKEAKQGTYCPNMQNRLWFKNAKNFIDENNIEIVGYYENEEENDFDMEEEYHRHL